MLMTEEMEKRGDLLSEHGVLVTEHGALGVASKEELKDVIVHHFGVRRHEFQVFRGCPEPFLLLFSEQSHRDIVFAKGGIVEGPYEFRFHLWDGDLHGSKLLIPYHIKLSLEGIPYHAWNQDTANKILCDETVIHHVDIETMRKSDLRAYVCWAFCQHRNMIPRVVYLTLVKRTGELRDSAQVHFTRPRSMKRGTVFRILVHIDYVEDLHFYHYPANELRGEGKIPLREFRWQFGQMDGEQEERNLQPLEQNCRTPNGLRRLRDDDNDEPRQDRRPLNKDIISRVSRWIDGRGRSRNREPERDRGSGWYRGESSRQRCMNCRSPNRGPVMHHSRPRMITTEQSRNKLVCQRRIQPRPQLNAGQ